MLVWPEHNKMECKPDKIQPIPAPRWFCACSWHKRLLVKFEAVIILLLWTSASVMNRKKTAMLHHVSKWVFRKTSKRPIFTKEDFCAHIKLFMRRSKTRKTDTITGLTSDTWLSSNRLSVTGGGGWWWGGVSHPSYGVIWDSNSKCNHMDWQTSLHRVWVSC